MKHQRVYIESSTASFPLYFYSAVYLFRAPLVSDATSCLFYSFTNRQGPFSIDVLRQRYDLSGATRLSSQVSSTSKKPLRVESNFTSNRDKYLIAYIADSVHDCWGAWLYVFGYGDKGSKGTIVSNMNSITRNNFIHFIRDDQANCNHLSCWPASLAIYFYRLTW